MILSYVSSAEDPITLLSQLIETSAFTLSFSYVLEGPDEDNPTKEQEIFVSHNLMISVSDSGVSKTNNSASGTFLNQFISESDPIKYLTSSNEVITVPLWEDVPDPSDPNFKSLVSYIPSSELSMDIEFVYTTYYKTDIDPTLIQTQLTYVITLLNEWDQDKERVVSTTHGTGGESSGGGGKPCATLGAISSGHATFPPKSNIGSASKVFISGKLAHRQGDAWAPHTSTAFPYPTHNSTTSEGSSKVIIEGAPAARIGDAISCGGAIVIGEPKVLCN